VHFTFEQVPIEGALHDIEAALAPFDPRPHPGKVHLTPGVYERTADFEALAERLDPRGAFRP
jgi:alditol oxidase